VANFRIITPHVFDAATLSSSPAASAFYPLSNLQTSVRSKRWRSTSVATHTILGNLLTASSLNGFALSRHNLSNAGTLRLRLYAGANQTSTLLYDSGTVTLGTSTVKGWGEFRYGTDPWGGGDLFEDWDYSQATIWFSTVASVLSFSLVITDSANAEGFLAASRIFLGEYFDPFENMEYGLRLSWQEASIQFRGGATLRTDGAATFRRWALSLPILSETERAELFDIAETLALNGDLFISCYPEAEGALERDYSGQVKMTTSPDFIHDRYNNHAVDLIFEEA
jgi:hypothetical protein